MSVFSNINHANALVTGASGGIGLEFVKQLLQDSKIAQIYATYRCQESASELIAIAEDYSNRLICHPMDVIEEAQIADVVAKMQSAIDKLHLAINCVGFLHEGKIHPEKGLRQVESESLLRYFQVNSIGGVLLAKHLLPLFRHSDRSVFASISAKIGSIGDNYLGGWYGYRASKAALNMLMRTVSIEYERKSPQTIVVTLHPGTTDTRLSKPFQRHIPAEELFSVERTVNQLLSIIQNLEVSDSGQFFHWDGRRLPW